jgi:hypothetical protein
MSAIAALLNCGPKRTDPSATREAPMVRHTKLGMKVPCRFTTVLAHDPEKWTPVFEKITRKQ